MLWKKSKSWLTVNGETTLALFIWWLSVPALGYVSGYFAFGKITNHVWLFGRFVRSADVWILHGKVYHKSVFNRKNFMKGLFLRWNILWRVCFWDETFCKGSIFEMKNFVKGSLTDLVLPLDRPSEMSPLPSPCLSQICTRILEKIPKNVFNQLVWDQGLINIFLPGCCYGLQLLKF